MTTLAEWEAELRDLRADPAWTQRAVIRWFPVRASLLRYPLIVYLTKRRRAEDRELFRWDVGVWPVTAGKGTRPAIVVGVSAGTNFPIAQPATVDVAGRVEVGAAVAIRFPNGDVVFGSLPAQPPSWFRRQRL